MNYNSQSYKKNYFRTIKKQERQLLSLEKERIHEKQGQDYKRETNEWGTPQLLQLNGKALLPPIPTHHIYRFLPAAFTRPYSVTAGKEMQTESAWRQRGLQY